MDLTYDECDVLIEALEKWESESNIGEVMIGGIMKNLASDKDSQREIERQLEERERQHQQKLRERKRMAAKLKAKLYDIQDQAMKADAGLAD